MPSSNDALLDLSWFRQHAAVEVIPRWLAAVDRPDGLFLPRLDRDWRQKPDQVATVVSQGRLVYDFSQGWVLTGDERYLDAVRRGADCLIDRFRDHELGGWYWMVGPDGGVLDPSKDSYGHAFAVFGLAHAVGCLSMMVVAVANRHIPGVKVVFAGLALNAVAILANGGFMPAASDAVKSVYGSIPAGDTSATVRHAIIDAHTRLSFLCDVIAAKWPYALVRSVYSVGDVITSAGALIAIVAIMRNPAYSKQPVLKEA